MHGSGGNAGGYGRELRIQDGAIVRATQRALVVRNRFLASSESRAMATEQVQVALPGNPSCCEGSNFGPLPDFPQRLRAAGIDEEDFKMVLQTCKDNEMAKLKAIGISFPVICVAWPCMIYYFSVVINPEEGARKFNSKYKEKNIKCARLMPGYSFVFTVPAEVAAVATPVPANMVREDDDQVAKLEKLQTMLEKGLVTQEEHDAKKAEILASM